MPLTRLLLRLTICFLFISFIDAQTFITGDNSSVADCTHGCSHKDESRFCLDGNAHFYERILMGQLRYYISTQVGLSLWHKSHKGVPRTKNETREDVREGLGLQWRGETDVVTEEIIDQMADMVTDRVEEINHRNRTHAPPTHCPIPCEYKNTVNTISLGLSIALNAILIATLIVILTKGRGKASRRNRQLVPTEEQ